MRLGTHAEPRRHLDLVAHERQQRRDEQRRAGALLAQHLRRDEVDGGLAPAGALHEQDTPPVTGDGLDRLELPGPEVGVGTEHEAQMVESRAVVSHARTVPSANDSESHPRPELRRRMPRWRSGVTLVTSGRRMEVLARPSRREEEAPMNEDQLIEMFRERQNSGRTSYLTFGDLVAMVPTDQVDEWRAVLAKSRATDAARDADDDAW